ncbi:hypothetical protein WMY93_025841 [Mugilogobius chulae]|uniref:Ig-like domain-containing protein n=1 Tax=Mugilogobius chulae TaxID=88201 RepID=A0AAW0N7N0_9GOBI
MSVLCMFLLLGLTNICSGDQNMLIVQETQVATLGCGGGAYTSCSGTSWTFSTSSSIPFRDLNLRPRTWTGTPKVLVQLNLTDACELQIQRVSSQDAGVYTCTRPAVHGSVCTVHPYGGDCGYSVKWRVKDPKLLFFYTEECSATIKYSSGSPDETLCEVNDLNHDSIYSFKPPGVPSPGTGHTMRGLLVQVTTRGDSWYKSRNEGLLLRDEGTPGKGHNTRGLLVQVTTRGDSWYKSRHERTPGTSHDTRGLLVQVTTREDSWYKSRHEGTPGASHDTMDSWYKSRDEGTPGTSHVTRGLLVQVTGRGDSWYKSRDEGTPVISHDTMDSWYKSRDEGTPGDSWYKSRDEGTPGISHVTRGLLVQVTGRGDSCYKSRDEGTPGASHDTRGLLVQVTGRGDSCYKSRDEGTPGASHDTRGLLVQVYRYRDEPEWNQTLDENITGPWNETVEEPHESWAVPVPLTELMFGLRLVELAVLFLILVLLLRLYTVGFLCRPSDRQQEAEETQEAMEETLFPYYNRIHYTAYTQNLPHPQPTIPKTDHTHKPTANRSHPQMTAPTTDRSYNRLHPQLSTFTIAYKHNRPHPQPIASTSDHQTTDN